MQLFDMETIWMPWVEFALLVVLILIGTTKAHAISNSIQMVASSIQRRYTPNNNSLIKNILCWLFILGTQALILLIALSAHQAYVDPLIGLDYLVAVAILAIVTLIKRLMDKWIQLTFRFAVSEQAYKEYRNDLWLVISILLWTVILICPWLNATARWVVPSVILLVYLGTLWWRIMQILGWSFQHSVFALVYMLHLELLPLAVAVIGIDTMINMKDLYYA